MKQNLSASLEDYLEVIAELIAVDGHAHTKEIAEKLNVKMPSVTGALRQLEKLGYIVYNAHYPVVLTPEGERIAEEVTHRHGVLKTFFASFLGLSPEKATAAACHLEHVVDSDTIKRFILFSKAIKQRSDAGSFRNFLAEAMDFLSREETNMYLPLSHMEKGDKGSFIQAGSALAGKEKDLPLTPGESFTMEDVLAEEGVCLIGKNGSVLKISLGIAQDLWVKPE